VTNHTKQLTKIENEIINLGWYEKHPDKDFCYYVAEKTGELGNDSPSDRAVKYAKRVLQIYRNRRKRRKNK